MIMPAGRKTHRFVVAQLALGCFFTLVMTYLSLALADHVGTPQLVRYIFSPGFVAGMNFASGNGLLERLGSFGRIAITINVLYYGLINFALFWKFNWPKWPKNPRRHFWMEQ
jgi:hypothetical protein